MRTALSLLGNGFLTWLVPFVAGMFLYTQDGQPRFDAMLVKSLLLLVAAGTTAALASRWLRRTEDRFVCEGLLIGATWTVVNWGLDAAVLLPLSGMSPGEYMARIGVGLLLLPVVTVAMGAALEGRVPARAA